MALLKTYLPVKRILNNLYFLFLLNGLLAASLFFFATEASYEKELFSAISQNIKKELPQNFTDQDYALKALETTGYLQNNRSAVFGSSGIKGITANFFHPSTVDLMTNEGACGSYVVALLRILKSNNIQVKTGQMKVNGIYGGHMILEAWIENRWVVMDPTFGLYFKNDDGSWASFKQLQANWNFYKHQTPQDYNQEYQYEDMRYTNREKIPVLTPAIKSIFNVILGREMADSISIRPYLLRSYHKLAWFTFIIWIAVMLHTAKTYSARKKTELHAPSSAEMKTKAA
ncbi:MAG: hypothetical protein K2X48_19250 [Chitinophagaceae bacterium]|nr:hypothetical protein [Chitinophagaceae bacterium]